MIDVEVELPTGQGRKRQERLANFASQLEDIQSQIDFRMSARGWAYYLEGLSLITKSQLDRGEAAVNECRDLGYLPIDFVAPEEGRKFAGVETPTQGTPISYMREWLEGAATSEEYYTPNWWKGETHYIQVVVEKIDLKELFEPVCAEYHIPIATAKGWSSKLMRATYARRFKEAESHGLKAVLLYAGDHDPDGLRIGDFIKSNLDDLRGIVWQNGTHGYDPKNLIIERFAINYEFIEEHGIPWIDNLETGSGVGLDDPRHKNNSLEYVQEYISKYGVRKVEANTMVQVSKEARQLCRDTIEKYLGDDALQRFETKRQEIRDITNEFRDRTGLTESIREAIELIEEEEDK